MLFQWRELWSSQNNCATVPFASEFAAENTPSANRRLFLQRPVLVVRLNNKAYRFKLKANLHPGVENSNTDQYVSFAESKCFLFPLKKKTSSLSTGVGRTSYVESQHLRCDHFRIYVTMRIVTLS